MKRALAFVIPLAALFVLSVTALAQSGGLYTLTWFSIAGGGGNSSGGSYALGGTAGQAAAGQMSGGPYTLTGGYWAASVGTNSSPSPTHTLTSNVTNTPTRTATRTNTPTLTRTPTRTNTPQGGNSPTATRTPTRTNTATNTRQGGTSPTATRTPTRTATTAVTHTPTNTPVGGCARIPDKPTLRAPANNATVGNARPKLKWNTAACAETYKVVVKDAVTGKTVDKKVGLTVLQYKTKALTTGTRYKWRVQACRATFGCSKSQARFFTVP